MATGTKRISVRVPDDLREACKRKVAATGETVTGVVIEALTNWVYTTIIDARDEIEEGTDSGSTPTESRL